LPKAREKPGFVQKLVEIQTTYIDLCPEKMPVNMRKMLGNTFFGGPRRGQTWTKPPFRPGRSRGPPARPFKHLGAQALQHDGAVVLHVLEERVDDLNSEDDEGWMLGSQPLTVYGKDVMVKHGKRFVKEHPRFHGKTMVKPCKNSCFLSMFIDFPSAHC
jgi:hypothetical protein